MGEDMMGAAANREPAEDEDMNSSEGQEVDEELGFHTEFDIHEEVPDLYRDGAIGRMELRRIRADIAATIRPGWQTGPPPNFGASAHGKVKADQWRSSFEFDIPVSLIQLWAAAPDGDRRQKMLESTMFLATAIRWATSHETSEEHVDEYMWNMRAYLKSLRNLFPGMNLLPNHHNALYLGELLLRFGPVHGWWMFPFERLIGLLQKVNTNKKMGELAKLFTSLVQRSTYHETIQGELEITMMESFCAASNLRSFVQGTRCPDAVAKCEPILNSMYGQDTRGTLMNDIRTLYSDINDMPANDDISASNFNEAKLKPLDEETYRALVTFAANDKNEGWTAHKEALLHVQHTIRGQQYQRSTASKKNSVIFFQPKAEEGLVPGVIRQIFSIPRTIPNGAVTHCVLFAVQRFHHLDDRIHNPFRKFENFGAGLWRDTTSQIEIITPSQKICHAIRRKWDDKTLVMKPLNRVSHTNYNDCTQ
jgi:hypothetical protein